MAVNIFHYGHCCVKECSMCKIVQLSVDFMRNVVINIFTILMCYFNIFWTLQIRQNIRNTKRLTLVELKVIQIK